MREERTCEKSKESEEYEGGSYNRDESAPTQSEDSPKATHVPKMDIQKGKKTLPMAHHYSADSDDRIQPKTMELKNLNQRKDNIIMEQEQDSGSDKDDTQTQTPSSASKTHLSNNIENALQGLVLHPEVNITDKSVELEPEAMGEDSGRERLKKHRVEVAGKVWIPDIWGQEEQLKDWVDGTTAFDAPLVPSSILTARTALVEEGPGTSTDGGLIVENRC
ncbi:unnamed protein product [Lupinus luteus]|uniref:Uncharacterized protein n=1 Tax=Lupinus luteus TaxID=3873 RepID=A0AAV1VQY4_LUPLU